MTFICLSFSFHKRELHVSSRIRHALNIWPLGITRFILVTGKDRKPELVNPRIPEEAFINHSDYEHQRIFFSICFYRKQKNLAYRTGCKVKISHKQ